MTVAALSAACSSNSAGPSPAPGSAAAALCAPPLAVHDPASPAPWSAPADPLVHTVAAGLKPEHAESLKYHVHAHLDVFVNAVPQTVPAGIGINTRDPKVHCYVSNGQASFGGITSPCAQPCISPLHTHDATGVLHTESATAVDNTLGQFFTEWGVRLDASCVGVYCHPTTPIAIYLDGKVQPTGDPGSIPLSNYLEIAIVIGTPPPSIPSKF